MKIEQVRIWWVKIDDAPGGAARALAPLAAAKIDLEFVLARRTPEDPGRGVIFVAPIVGDAAESAARAAGMVSGPDLAGLRVTGDNRAGMGHAITQCVSQSGVSLRGMAANVLGKTYVCYLAVDSVSDADRVARALSVLQPAARRAGKGGAARKGGRKGRKKR